jgi:hypothetical protein
LSGSCLKADTLLEKSYRNQESPRDPWIGHKSC